MSVYAFIRKFYKILSEKKRQKYFESLKSKGLRVGRNVNIVSDYFFDPSHCFLISIGDNTTIAPNVRLIAHDASTFNYCGYTKIGKIEIKENCFIGDSTIVLPNVTIGPNSIVGSGSVVTKNVPPNSIAVGNPARVIGSLTDYLEKIEKISKEKKIFGKDYYIDELDTDKRNEILESIDESIGFIV